MPTTTQDPLQRLFNAGDTAETAQAAVARLDDIAAAIDRLRLASAEEFERAYAVKRALGSLGCYLFNNHLEPWERVFALEAKVGALMRRWARGYFGRFTPETMALVRYLLWNHRYTSESLPKIVTHLIGARAIVRLPDGRVCVRGPHLAQGDNVFGIRQDGSQFRRYVRVCVPQVYVVPRDLPEALAAQIPVETLPEFVNVSHVGASKYGVRVTLSDADRRRIATEYCR